MKKLFTFATEAFASANAAYPGRMGEQQAKLATSRSKVLAAKLKGSSDTQYSIMGMNSSNVRELIAMRNVYHVHTPENVTLEFELAGVGSRGTAVVIDTLIQNIFLLAVILAIALISGDSSVSIMAVQDNTFYIVAGLLLMFVLQFGYFSLFEYFMKGATPGKRIVGLKVMMANGEPITLAASLIRNFIRIGDMLPGIYGVGIISMVLGSKYMRVGDLAANTVVVKDKGRKGAYDEVAGNSSEQRSSVISPKEEALLREYRARKRNPKNPLSSYILEAQLYHHFYAKIGPVPNLPDSFSKRMYLEKLFEYLNIG